jgi:antitoxin (DNA-binding transcriptional repressor) of toxin-antitoxin stability system
MAVSAKRVATPAKRFRVMDEHEFATHCLALIDEVNESGIEIIIARAGVPIVRLIPWRRKKRKMRPRKAR